MLSTRTPIERARGFERLEIAVLVALGGIAFLVRLVPLLRGAGITGILDYDDGVYFGSALALLGGRVPYRDFLLLHPPGILYVLAPFAALAAPAGDANALSLARIGFMVLGAANTILVGVAARPMGRLASIAAAALYAVWSVPAGVERTTWLIAPQTTLLLLALLVLQRQRGQEPVRGAEKSADTTAIQPRTALVAGTLLGLAVSIQIWNVIPLLVVVGWLAITARRRQLAPGSRWVSLRPAAACLGAGLLAVGIATLPFVLVSGGNLVRYTLFDQFGRVGATGSLRFGMLAAAARIPGLRTLVQPHPAPWVVLAVLAIIVAVALVTAAVRHPPMRPWLGVLVGQVAFLAAGPVFFSHYAGWPAPLVALVVGGTLAAAVQTGRRPALPRVARSVAVPAFAVIVGMLFVTSIRSRVGTRFDSADITRAVAGARCVTADSPVLLIETGALARDLVAGCALRLDPSGTSYDTGHGLPRGARPRLDDVAYQDQIVAYYESGDAALFARRSSDKLQPGSWSAVRGQLGDDRWIGRVDVLVRTETPGN